jgi:glycosyltransferase involved in cell wall biosynthesis
MTTNTIDLCEGLVKIGHHVSILVAKPTKDYEYTFQKRLIDNGVKVFNFPSITNSSKSSQVFTTIKIIGHILAHKYDIIHVESPYLTFIPWLLHKKFTSTFHVNDLVPCFYYKNATHLIAISNETKSYAMEHFGFRSEDITIVNHGVSVRFAQKLSEAQKVQIKTKYKIPNDKLIIGFVGSIEPRKGHDILIKAVDNLSDIYRSKVHIVFVGDDKSSGKNTEWLKSLIQSSMISKQISCIGYTDPQPLYQIFDIFCLPSRLEGFPVVTLEALMSGNCVIRSLIEGTFEQIQDGKTGFIFEKDNVTQLRDILSTLISNPSLIEVTAKQGQQDALQRFTLEAMAKNTAKVYHKIIDKH